MKPNPFFSGVSRRALLSTLAALPALAGTLLPNSAPAQTATSGGPLPSWNDGAAKQAIIKFVRTTTDKAKPRLRAAEDRVAVFDQDGTLWVEHPIYTQVVYCLERVPQSWRSNRSSRMSSLSGPCFPEIGGDGQVDDARFGKNPGRDVDRMTVEEFEAEVKKWLETARHPRWNRPYTELIYQPMLEVLRHMRDNGFKTYIVTGGGQDFVRVYSERVYGIPLEQVVGTVGGTKFGYDRTVSRS